MMMAVEADVGSSVVITVPGEPITTETGYLRGHGTYVVPGEEAGASELVSSVAGVVERVNKLISVRPLNSRFGGEVGDVVVGRITEVGNKRWKVDVSGRADAVLNLGSVNLPGGAQRRRTMEDQLQMRALFVESDLISAEVASFYKDGAMAVHTRSFKYGKLENGQLVKVAPSLIKRVKQHFVTLPCKVDLILAHNGWLWLTETPPALLGGEEGGAEGSAERARMTEQVIKQQRHNATRTVGPEGRERVARVRNAVVLLASAGRMVHPAPIMAIYNRSVALGCDPRAMLVPDAKAALLEGT